MESKQADQNLYKELVVQYSYMVLWILLSASVILYNKYILSFFGFPYPVSLTMIHMAFCSSMAFILVKAGWVAGVNMTNKTFLTCVVPIGALFACTLWLGNAAYLYLSVSFIQMLKAFMPVAVFIVGIAFGNETYSHMTAINMIVVGTGIAIASYGEINFVVIGVVVQAGSIAAESTRLTLVQVLLQKQGIKLNPITTLYYIAPCCLVFLFLPFFAIEAGQLANDPEVKVDILVFISNAAIAFALNMSVFLLIGKTSALTMNIAGVIKDWLLIAMSYFLFKAPITYINILGYFIAFSGVCWFNYRKIMRMRQKQQEALQPQSNEERNPLLSGNDGDSSKK